jgi:pyruvate ferredoxin oxidoreductase beta subunit
MINNIPEEEYFAPGHRACAGCGCALAMRFVTKAVGKNVIISQATGCMEVISSPYPQTAWRVPWIHTTFENAAAVGSGIEKALKKFNKDTKVLMMGGDGGTFDIGFQALSGAAERGHDFLYLCYDNGAYMNTGIQRSGATPKYAATTTSPAGKKIHGKQEYKKNMPFIMAMHGAYVATASIAFPQDFIKKVQWAINKPGPAYIQVYAPCPLGWRSNPADTIAIAKLAVETKAVILYEIDDGKLKNLKRIDNPKPLKEYLQTQGRFKHLNDDEIGDVQNWVNSEYDKIVKLEESQIRIF